MQADQSRFVTVLGGEGDAANSEANFASKKALKQQNILKYHLMH